MHYTPARALFEGIVFVVVWLALAAAFEGTITLQTALLATLGGLAFGAGRIWWTRRKE